MIICNYTERWSAVFRGSCRTVHLRFECRKIRYLGIKPFHHENCRRSSINFDLNLRFSMIYTLVVIFTKARALQMFQLNRASAQLDVSISAANKSDAHIFWMEIKWNGIIIYKYIQIPPHWFPFMINNFRRIFCAVKLMSIISLSPVIYNTHIHHSN